MAEEKKSRWAGLRDGTLGMLIIILWFVLARWIFGWLTEGLGFGPRWLMLFLSACAGFTFALFSWVALLALIQWLRGK